MEGLIVLGVVVVILAVIVAGLYNSLVSARQHVRESWSGVDTELQRRHDLIPNLVNTVKGYMTHERELLEQVTALREEAERLRPGEATAEQLDVESRLAGALGQISVRMEAYPDLKASENFSNLQSELANTEDRVQAALRFYNGNVRELNTKVESVPTNFIAGMFNFKKAQYFELKNEAAREVPQVSF
ncbi:MAG: LemA family protein [Planctomycetota bacterium]